MNKNTSLKIIVVIAIIVDFIIFCSLIYSNRELKIEISNLKYNYTELQDSILVQNSNISNITTKVNENSEFIEKEKEQKKIESDPYAEAINNLDNTIFLIDFENYTPTSNDIKISEKKAKEIAQKGFE